MSVSIIIPTWNEAPRIANAVLAARRQRPLEIIVADGGSPDGTHAAAHAADVVLTTPPGRGLQMNRGAAVARGDVLVFLHADCILEDDSLPVLERLLNGSHVAAACFKQRIQAEGPLYRWIDLVAHARVRLTGIVYGDQGLCVRRDRFWAVGGFAPVRFLEDVLLARTLRRQGRVLVVPKDIQVSPRRWQTAGLVRQTVRNWTLLGLASMGVAPDRLAKYYPAVR